MSEIWTAGGEARHEINISSAYLDRPLEEIAASLMHEMCHLFNDALLKVQDVSNGGRYHNARFKAAAEAHGLECRHDPRYGWCRTSPAEALIDWLIDHSEFNEIELARNTPGAVQIGIGTSAANGGAFTPPPKAKSSTRRYICPCCKQTIRATRTVNIVCGDCLDNSGEVIRMVEG